MNSFRLKSETMFTRSEEYEQEPPLKIVFLSVEGNKTEQQYFEYIEKYRDYLGIKKVVHIHSLRRSKHDNLCAPEDVLELLEEYMELRNAKDLPERLRRVIPEKYSYGFIRDYLDNNVRDDKTKEFEMLLQKTGIDLQYEFFLKEISGKNDVFGVVLDRDYKSHSVVQMNSIIEQCKEKGYKCFVTTPLFEFWLLLHLTDVCNEYENEMDKILDNPVESVQHTYTSKQVSEKAHHAKAIREATFVKYYLPNIDFAINQVRSNFTMDLDELVGNDNSVGERKGKLGTNIPELFDLLRNDEKIIV